MHCTLDLELTPEILHQKDTALTALLTKANVTLVNEPLVKLRLEQSGIGGSTSMAALAAESDGLLVTSDIWLMAEPVHFVLQRDAFSLYPEVPVKLSNQEAKAYQAILNKHFQLEGIAFYIGDSGQWYVNVQKQSGLSHYDGLTHPCHALGQSVDAFLPSHANAKQWLQILNEVQMLLYDSPENQIREEAGQLAVNSVWLHGGQVASGKPGAVTGVCYMSDRPSYRGLAAKNQAICHALPDHDSDLGQALVESDAQAIILDLTQVTAQDAWLLSCQHMLKRHIIHHLCLNLGLPGKTLVANVKPFDLWRFWRKSQTVTQYIQ